MKPPARPAGAKASPSSGCQTAAGWQGGSHIPLPLRRSSTKSEKANDGEEIGLDAEASKDRPRAMRAAEGRYGNTERGGGKMSLLGSTSFCCASGQKEDCGTRDSQMAPVPRPQKRKPKNGVKKDPDTNAESSGTTPVVVKKITTPRTRRAKVDNDSVDTKDARRTVECSPKARRSSVAEEKSGKALPNNQMYQNNKLKVVEGVSLESSQSKAETKSEEQQSGRGGCSDAGVGHKQEKYKDVFQKLRKNPSHCTTKNIMALNVENKLYDKHVRNYEGRRSDLGSDEKTLLIDNCPGERRDARSVKNEVEDADAASSNNKESGGEQADNSHGTVFGSEEECARDNCDKDDLDCPCCDNIQEESVAEENLMESHSQDLVGRLEKDPSPISSPTSFDESIPICSSGIAEVQEKDGLEQEVTTLKEELEQERLKLQSQQGHVLQLEKEMEMMEQMKLELIREKQLRKEAEMRLLEVLDRGKRSYLDESQASDNLEETTSELTEQESINNDISQLEDESSPLLLGYESRVRRYQTYIAKLEKDNMMLVNELKHLKDLSPCSQKEQAKTLLEKLGQLERDSQQQQVQYESCLDEVANRLVQTLLTQKRLEEECKELHRRVQQLETENKELVEMVDVTGKKMVKTAVVLPKGFCNQTEEPNVQMTPLTTELIILPLLTAPKQENIDASSQRTLIETKKEILPSKIGIATAKQFTTKNAKNREPQLVDIQHTAEDVASSTKHPCASRIPAFNNPSFNRIKTKSDINLLTEEQQNFHQSSSLPTVNDLKNATDSSSPAIVPNTTHIKATTIESNLMNNISDAVDYTKLSSVKRKRITRLGSTFDKGTKEVRLKSKSQHIQWDQAIKSEGDLKDDPFSKTVRKFRTNLLLQAENQNDIWNFNCVMKEPAVINTLPKDLLRQKDMVNTYSSSDVKECDSENCSPKVFSPLPETDSSASTDGVHRTRDEGYSTMSSDLQPDSAADTTMSEQSATYIASETALQCSDDSVTECLDGSMSSSSDSGFGPLQNFARNSLPHLEDSAVEEDSSDSQKESDYSPVTAKCKPVSGENVSKQIADKQKIKFSPETTDKQQISLIAKQVKFKPQFSRFTFDNASFVQNDENVYQDSHPVSHQGPKDAWTRTDCDDVSFYCSKKIPNFIQEEKVETAEKATLTEPEEELWREKALAHFIDESIWSLYSSESDIHLKPLSEQLSYHQSVEDLDYQIGSAQKEQYPPILLTKMSNKSTSSVEDTYDASEIPQNSKHQHLKSSVTTLTDDVQNLIQDQSKLHFSAPSLERVASDTVLYLKDSFRELEISMKPGLKTTRNAPKNIPLFHHLSISDIAMQSALQSERETKSTLDSEILKKLHNSMLVQNTLHWPLQTNNSRSTSLSSVQSSTSCHVISDEMDDDDIIHTSRKGSRDPDLSSASDAEHENLEHKDFVEQWLQKEISQDDSRNKGNFKLEKGTWSLQDANKNKTNECFEAINEIKPLLSSPDLSLPSSDLSPDGVCGSPTTLQNTHISNFLSVQSLHSDSQILFEITESGESKDHDFCTELPTCEVPCASSSVCGHSESHINHLTPSSEEIHSLSSTLYPILCCHDNVPEENAKLCECVSSNGTNQVHDLDEEGQADSLEPEVKAFNRDFYRLCSVGSLKSLEAFIPSSSDCMESQEFCLKQYSNSPKFKRSPVMKYREPFAKNVVLDHKRYKHFEGKANKIEPAHSMHPYNLLSVSNNKSDSNYQKDDVNKYSSVFHSQPVSQQLSCSSNSCFHPNSLCTNEHKSACRSRLKSSLPKQTISSDNQQNNMSVLSLSFQNTIKESAGQKMCLNGQDLPLYSTERLQPAILSSPEIKISNPNCSAVSPDQKPNRIHPQGIINSPRTDAVSRRQQLRRERWNARQNRIKEGCGTAWVHVHANADLTDPKARASLLDSMMATSSSGSSTDEEEEMLVIHNNSQLQRICRERRHKAKASGKDEFFAISPRIRSTIMNRHGLYYRYGEQEKEAIACFDFLEELSTSTSEVGSMELLNNRLMIPPHYDVHDSKNFPIDRTATSSSTSRSHLSSFSARLRLPGLWNKPLSHNMSSSTLNSQDCELLDHISLSDSCAESYSSTPDSYEEAS